MVAPNGLTRSANVLIFLFLVEISAFLLSNSLREPSPTFQEALRTLLDSELVR